MKIELCEDNGFVSADGKPTLVVMVITLDNGTVKRFPYEAKKTIQQLYVDVKKLSSDNPDIYIPLHNPVPEMNEDWKKRKKVIIDEICDDLLNSALSTKIAREDIVKCVKLHPREGPANAGLKVGGEYRVIEITAVNGQAQSYELIDDSAPIKERLTFLPDEVVLLRKALPKPPRVMIVQGTVFCDSCGEENVFNINAATDCFEGDCNKCKKYLKRKKFIEPAGEKVK